MKYPKFNKSRKEAMRALYELCLEHQFTIAGTADFHDEGEEDRFEIDIGVAGVEIEAVPKESEKQRQHPTHHFLVDKEDGKWQKGVLQPVIVIGHD
jgi:hypothetical protein